MQIGQIITKHYNELSGMVRNPDVTIENGNTSEDIFQSAIVTVLKKYKDQDITDEEGFEYAKKTVLTELFFCYKRKGRDMLIFSDENFDSIPG